MHIFSVIAIAVTGTAASLLVKRIRPELASVIAACTGLLLFSMCFGDISDLIKTVQSFGSEYGLEMNAVGLAMKIIGIAY